MPFLGKLGSYLLELSDLGYAFLTNLHTSNIWIYYLKERLRLSSLTNTIFNNNSALKIILRYLY